MKTPEIEGEFRNKNKEGESVQSHAELNTNLQGLLLKDTPPEEPLDNSLPIINILQSQSKLSGSSATDHDDSNNLGPDSVSVSTNSEISLQDCQVKEDAQGESLEWEIAKLAEG